MFSKKKKCKRCNSKISKDDDFCKYCGTKNTEEISDNGFGMLGKNDLFHEADIRMPMGFGSLFNSLMTNLEKEFQSIDKEFGKQETKETKLPPGVKRGGINISISTATGKPPVIKVQSHGNMPEFKAQENTIKKQIKEKPSSNLSDENIKKFSKLPRQEPKTNVRRLSDRVIYEIDMPGVKSEKEVSITKLENSIEIKAVSKDKAYFKLIPIKLPIINYEVEEGKLILELGEE